MLLLFIVLVLFVAYCETFIANLYFPLRLYNNCLEIGKPHITKLNID